MTCPNISDDFRSLLELDALYMWRISWARPFDFERTQSGCAQPERQLFGGINTLPKFPQYRNTNLARYTGNSVTIAYGYPFR